MTSQVLEYNVIGGKYQRGLTVLVTLQALVEPKELDADSLQRALTVGWCVELVRAVGKGPEESFPGGVPWVGAGGGEVGLKLVSGLFVFLCLLCAAAEFTVNYPRANRHSCQ